MADMTPTAGYVALNGDDGSGQPCEHCGKVWLHGDCFTTLSRQIRCLAQPQVPASPNDGSRS